MLISVVLSISVHGFLGNHRYDGRDQSDQGRSFKGVIVAGKYLFPYLCTDGYSGGRQDHCQDYGCYRLEALMAVGMGFIRRMD